MHGCARIMLKSDGLLVSSSSPGSTLIEGLNKLPKFFHHPTDSSKHSVLCIREIQVSDATTFEDFRAGLHAALTETKSGEVDLEKTMFADGKLYQWKKHVMFGKSEPLVGKTLDLEEIINNKAGHFATHLRNI